MFCVYSYAKKTFFVELAWTAGTRPRRGALTHAGRHGTSTSYARLVLKRLFGLGGWHLLEIKTFNINIHPYPSGVAMLAKARGS